MEDTLTLDELYLLVDAKHRREEREHKFLAAIQGIDLDAGTKSAEFEEIERRAAAALAGVSEEEFVLSSIGIEYESDDDD